MEGILDSFRKIRQIRTELFQNWIQTNPKQISQKSRGTSLS